MNNIKEVVSMRIKLLEEAKATYRWEAEKKVYKSDYKFFYISIVMMTFMMAMVMAMVMVVNVIDGKELLDNIQVVLTLAAVCMPIFTCFFYYIILVKPTYKFELTCYGIRGVESSNVAEFWHHLGKAIVWGGMIACIAILFVAGPMAFAGAGGSALLVFSLRNQMGREKPITILFGDEIEIEHERKTKDMFINDCRYREYGDYYKHFEGFIYYEGKQYKEILSEIEKLGTKIYYPALRNRQKKHS
ncbi:hypothetical protein [Thaumasiovibrio subtropicus]|uniref:hypothetical protein n=2 Tax=Thaumasiovibrio subtropicus TaxID=1891207 RepID=UPI001C8665A0|nr:hypothetical protein [Thaumasiovibrio subtropicus]